MHRELKMRCSICDACAEVIDGSVVRSCAHSAASVIADMEAVAIAVGSVRDHHCEVTEWPL